ncbi:MAG: hypothetical protein JO158_07975 [Gammaproteobacteria bacterium]|nr:hypothetical protein [Gammaproteobacteria bacterium]MBV8974644.1 hypothetical protein [Nevskiaceae bacterium]MBV9316342.1 hypothetical protein [Gammaproteobacteria bacterium]MBV9727223.1 hypothetical protein [Gammaproteobacteria bacterium]
MSRANKEASEESATVPGESFDVALRLKPAELEALIARLCACGTRRVKSAAPRGPGSRCAGRPRVQWCRLGERGAGAGRYADSRFG